MVYMTAIENFKLSGSQKRKYGTIALMIVFLAGILIGTLLVCMGKDRLFTAENAVFRCFIKDCSAKTVIEVFCVAFKPMLMLLTLQFLLGFFAVGQPIAVVTVALKGVVSGISASAIYLEYGAKGAIVNLLTLLPYVILSSFIIITGARESFRFSDRFLCYAFGANCDSRPEVKLYCLRFIVLIIFSVAVSAADSVIEIVFGRLLIP